MEKGYRLPREGDNVEELLKKIEDFQENFILMKGCGDNPSGCFFDFTYNELYQPVSEGKAVFLSWEDNVTNHPPTLATCSIVQGGGVLIKIDNGPEVRQILVQEGEGGAIAVAADETVHIVEEESDPLFSQWLQDNPNVIRKSDIVFGHSTSGVGQKITIGGTDHVLIEGVEPTGSSNAFYAPTWEAMKIWVEDHRQVPVLTTSINSLMGSGVWRITDGTEEKLLVASDYLSGASHYLTQVKIGKTVQYRTRTENFNSSSTPWTSWKEVYYTKPSGGIPATDLTSAVQASLSKADSAIQEHQDISGKQDKIDASHKLSADLVEDGTTNKAFTATEKTKLSEIAAGAEVNQNAFSNIKVGSTTIQADGKTDTLELVAGDNITLTPNATNDTITIASTASGSDIDPATEIPAMDSTGAVGTSEKYAREDHVHPSDTTKADKATTLTGYGITDAKIESGTITLGSNSITPLTQHQDISGKADKATTLSGYGITDANINNGTITLGSNSITPLTSHQDISGKADKATTLAGYGITDAKITSGTITLGSESITPITEHQTINAISIADIDAITGYTSSSS